jgi:hypothetical protein
MKTMHGYWGSEGIRYHQRKHFLSGSQLRTYFFDDEDTRMTANITISKDAMEVEADSVLIVLRMNHQAVVGGKSLARFMRQGE